ncbi:MAG: DUF1566 domain-containing protein, partial [Myxococcota bacterium]|nr:DUF1566 domain-containing protein [Myxococcota bacterium]
RDAGADAATETDAAADAAPGGDQGAGYARWPIPALPGTGGAHEQRYEIAGDTALDAITGLTWQRGDAGDLRTHEGALAYCDALVLEARDDFRLPSRIETISILDPTRSPALDPDAFPDAAPEYHWTSSLAPETPGSAYSVYLGAGETTLGLTSRPSARVRCVAGGPPAIEAPHFEILDAETVRDRGTGLVWSRAALAASSWPDARDACAAIGARLPSIRELQSIVDETRLDPMLDPALFPDARSVRHWSSTLRDAGELLPWTLDTLDAQTFADDSTSARHLARCVRE